jgi:sec-independent protein translocase protein TatC
MSTGANPGKVMPIIEHIRELRNSILVSMAAFLAACIVSFIFSSPIIALFTRQFEGVDNLVNKTLVVSSISEGFMSQLKMTLIAGLILSLPVHIFGIVKFIFPGLTTRERRIVMFFLVFSLVLIVVGAYLAYFKIVPLVVKFMTGPGIVPKNVGFILNYQTNIFYVFNFILWSVIALQTPLIMEILLIMNVLKRRTLLKASRYIIVGIFIFAAIITPPDPISQLGVALPLVFFYYMAILFAKIFKFGED